jgi:hypothetical protein
VRDPLLTLGCPDPVERLKEIKARDPSRQRAAEIFTTWWECHQDNPIRVSAVDARVIEIIDPGQKKHSLNWQAARVAELVGTRQSGFVLEIFGVPGAGERGTEYRLQMTDDHSTSDAPKPPTAPVSPAAGEENTFGSVGYGNGRDADAVDNMQAIRRTRGPPADHPQGHPTGNGQPDQSPANPNAGSAGNAGSLAQPNDGFSKWSTEAEANDDLTIPAFLDRCAEATRVCAQCGAGRPSDLPTIAVTAKDGRTVYVHEHGCLRFWKKITTWGRTHDPRHLVRTDHHRTPYGSFLARARRGRARSVLCCVSLVMGKGPCAFKEADITRAYKAAIKAGVMVEIKLSLDRKEMTLTPVKVSDVGEQTNPWDEVLGRATNKKRAS